jgi:hypothetical protein
MSKILFILKRREDYSTSLHSHVGLSTGLYNSASFMDTMLQEAGYDSALEVAIDNNCIDRLVTKHRPTHVIIEALWVVPSKFGILQKLHPNVIWIIRIHSEMPFMAGEGNALNWVGDYTTFRNVIISCNAPRMLQEVRNYLQVRNNWTNQQTWSRVIYQPNYYPQDYITKSFDKNKDHVDIACFGAIRPLKNHVLQAFGALEFAGRINKKLRFHVNAGRIEMQGGPALNNLRGLFEQLVDTGHELINHQWCPREDFLKICAQMDIGLQVSFSETFNIVGADLISQGVPLVGSNEIPWSSKWFNADPTNSHNIADKLERTYNNSQINVWLNQRKLTRYTNQTFKVWTKYFTK